MTKLIKINIITKFNFGINKIFFFHIMYSLLLGQHARL